MFKVREVSEGGFWGRQAERVMRHPVPYAVSVSLILIVLAIPFFRLNLGLSDDRVGPKDMSSRVATEQYRKNFATREADALSVYVPGIDTTADRARLSLRPHAQEHSGVTRVGALTGSAW